jgi:hypothetical protein
MKKLAIIAALAAATLTSYAQKAVVTLNNYTPDSPVYYLTKGTVAPTSLAFSITTAAGAALQDTAGNNLTFVWDSPGYFDLQTAVIPGVTGGANVDLTFKAWNPATPTESVTATWSQATANWAGVPSPASGPDLALPTGLTVTGVVPEPTTLALGLIGAAALMLRRRK